MINHLVLVLINWLINLILRDNISTYQTTLKRMILNADIQAHKLVFQKAFKSLKSKMWRNVGES